jgi:hypothetical protein
MALRVGIRASKLKWASKFKGGNADAADAAEWADFSQWNRDHCRNGLVVWWCEP